MHWGRKHKDRAHIPGPRVDWTFRDKGHFFFSEEMQKLAFKNVKHRSLNLESDLGSGMHATLAPEKLGQEDKLKASLSYTVRILPKKNKHRRNPK